MPSNSHNFLIFFTLIVVSTTASAQQLTAEDLLKMDMEALLRVTVTTASRQEQEVGNVPASVVVITRKDIETYGYASLDRILENVPGLFNIDNRFEGSIFGVRGFWSAVGNNIILLVNGVRMERMESDGTVYPSVKIPPEAIDRIEVIRGPMSVIYGPGAFFGAINIITHDANSGSGVTFSAGLEKTVRATARVAVEKEDMSLVFNAGTMETDGPDIPHSRMSSQDWTRFGTTFHSTRGRWGSREDYFSLSASYKGFYANFQYNENYREWYLFKPPSTPEGSKFWRNYMTMSAGYKHEFSPQFQMDSRLSYRRGFTRGNFGWYIPEDGMNISGDINHKDDFEVDMTAYYHPSQHVDLTVGLYYKKKTTDQLQGTYPQFNNYVYRLGLITPVKQSAAYAQIDVHAAPWLSLTVGGRAEYINSYDVFSSDVLTLTGTQATYEGGDIYFIPRIASIFYLKENHILKLLYGRALTLPSSYKAIAMASNPLQTQLEPEYITTLECNYLTSLSDRIGVNLSLFYNSLDNLIVNASTWNEEDTEFVPYNENSGELRTFGSEVTLTLKPTARFQMELSGTIQKTEDQRSDFNQIEVAYSPRKLGYFKAAWQVTQRMTFSVLGRYVGAMHALWDERWRNPEGEPGGRIAQSVDSYVTMVANLRINNILPGGYFFSLNGSNLLDAEYLFPSYTFNAPFTEKGMPGYGRMIQASVGKRF